MKNKNRFICVIISPPKTVFEKPECCLSNLIETVKIFRTINDK